ncbi:4,5:9,10-diseco-3-hydroxy-5,9,17-trioxoandrosta-1(10),2-diene-4-oate hydrolase [Streptomyces sp. CC224B]|uniref:4,5:9,10-diseco-3-hydroxy-5,9, 17-trioxoandrosta-1(10),2-diene-4-oate hydrolase n=1 Tax=Streptomyces sp. CC224B TaxID=3044571 RepID=UPI0024A7B879|nr:4,5:9,10-diseco-3-hydroxy-5,9,17-trioxoandrosta-1(10),2-diene-4-oate hydrolase [Streptomyces sp. CC224B]
MTSANSGAEFSRAETSRVVEAGGLRLRYHEAGPRDPAAPVLVMLHGGGPGAGAWSAFGHLLPAFARHFRTLLVDQPGFGASDKPELDRDFYSFSAAAVAALLDELGVERAHVAGASLGGGACVRLALDHPGRVDRLLLMAPGGLALNVFTAEPSDGVRRLIEFGNRPEPTREDLRAFLTTLVHDPSYVTDDLVEERYAAALDPGARLGARCVGAAFAAWPHEAMLWREAHRVTRPTLLTWGREDRVNPLDGAFVALKAMPDARLHVFPRCGHLAFVERADAFVRLAVDFLTEPV